MKKKINKSIIITMALVLIMAMIPASVFAGNSCPNIKGTSKFDSKVVFTVNTGERAFFKDYILLKQTKGVMRIQDYKHKYKTFNCYGMYIITVTDLTTKKTECTKTWKDGSCKIKFKKDNHKYRVTVKSRSKSDYQAEYFYRQYIVGWNKYANWRIDKTKGVNCCK